MQIFCDSGSLADIHTYWDRVDGFTTNPSLMKKAGHTKYRDFAAYVMEAVKGKPVSFEVLSDDWSEMEDQAYTIASWGENCHIKIPITNTKGEMCIDLIDKLQDLNLNITAVMTKEQLDELSTVDRAHHIISVFAGRIADTGRVPPFSRIFHAKLLWASARQLYNIQEATESGYDIITLSPELIGKMHLIGKDLKEYSLDTVKQFHEDGRGIEF